MNRLIPDMKSGARPLEAFRKKILDGQNIQNRQLNHAIARFEETLRKFATISGQKLQYDRIVAIVEEMDVRVSRVERRVEKLEQQASLPTDVIRRLEVLERRDAELPLAKPAEVAAQLRQMLLAETDRAEAAYKKGYDLLERYRFAEAIPYLEQALQAVKLPDFYTALGRAYMESQVLGKGEQVAREGIEYAVQREDAQFEANMSNLLGTILLDKRDLDGALKYIQRALTISEKVYGPDHRNVVSYLNNIGVILLDKGDLDGALKYIQRAVTILSEVYGLRHPSTVKAQENLDLIRKTTKTK